MERYNLSVRQALAALTSQKETYIIQEKEHTVLVENGQFIGMGAYAASSKLETLTVEVIEKIKSAITPYAENEVLKSMIRKYVERYPHKVLPIKR